MQTVPLDKLGGEERLKPRLHGIETNIPEPELVRGEDGELIWDDQLVAHLYATMPDVMVQFAFHADPVSMVRELLFDTKVTTVGELDQVIQQHLWHQ